MLKAFQDEVASAAPVTGSSENASDASNTAFGRGSVMRGSSPVTLDADEAAETVSSLKLDDVADTKYGCGRDAFSIEVGTKSPTLQFPTVAGLDLPSPDPLPSGSPPRWQSQDHGIAGAPAILHDTPVRGLLTREPRFSDYSQALVLFNGEDAECDAEASPSLAYGDKHAVKDDLALETFQDQSIDDFLSSILPACVADGDLDYSFALENDGPPLIHLVPKVGPLQSVEKAVGPQGLPVACPLDPKYLRSRSPMKVEVATPLVIPRVGAQFSRGLLDIEVSANALSVQVAAESNKNISENGTSAWDQVLDGQKSLEYKRPLKLDVPNTLPSAQIGAGVSPRPLDRDVAGSLDMVHASTSRKSKTCENVVFSQDVLSVDAEKDASTLQVKNTECVVEGKKLAVSASDPLHMAAPSVISCTSARNSSRVLAATVDSMSRKSSGSVSHESSIAESETVDFAAVSASASASASVSASEHPSPARKASSEGLPDFHDPTYAESALPMGPIVDSDRQLLYRDRFTSLPSVPQPARHSKSNSVVSEFSQQLHYPEEENPVDRPRRRKGECHRCLKGNRLTEKEVCLVCDKKYCCNCVLIAMGSMPEGRKCTLCIGKAIHESKRQFLGKCSRLLKGLLSPLEIHQILKAERECAANQLHAEQLVVNNKPLSPEEMAELLSCEKPPMKLKPGRYWYDQQSGLWGKEGEHPDQIISSSLKVGGSLQSNASNGNTGVFMNDRELGKQELRLLKFAGVHCPSGTHLWVDDDGSYSDVGQKDDKGNLWEKMASVKWFCPFSSLRFPRGSPSLPERRKDFANKYFAEYLEPKRTQKLLLLGREGSGRSTVFKQAKYLFKDGFSPEELQAYKSLIQSNAYKYISILLEGRERFEDADFESDKAALTSSVEDKSVSSTTRTGIQSPYTLGPRLNHRADWFLEIMATGSLQTFFPAATREYAPIVEALWQDPAIQATFKRRDELHMLPDVAGYFLEKFGELSSNEYEPSEEDVLAAEGLTQGSGLAEIEFIMEEKAPVSGPFIDPGDSSTPVGRYQLIRVGGVGVTEGRKWLEMFEDVCAVIFCVALSDYDQMSADSSGVLRNRMIQSKELFETILQHPYFRDTPFILLFSKYDVFEEKISKGIPLSTCEWLSDFRPVKSTNNTPQNVAQQAYQLVVKKFKEVYASVSHAKGVTGRRLWTHELYARDRSNVKQAFEYIREVLKWEENKAGWSTDYSYSTDTNSVSPALTAFYPPNNGSSVEGVACWYVFVSNWNPSDAKLVAAADTMDYFVQEWKDDMRQSGSLYRLPHFFMPHINAHPSFASCAQSSKI